MPFIFLMLTKNFIEKTGDEQLIINEDKTVLPPDFYRLLLTLSGNDDREY